MAAAVVCALAAAALTFAAASGNGQNTARTVPVLVVSSPLAAGALIDERAAGSIVERRYPADLAPPDALAEISDAVGMRARIDLPAGSLVTSSAMLGSSEGEGALALRRGERAVTVDVIAPPGGSRIETGQQVDLFASGVGGSQKTELVIAGAQVLAVDDSGAGSRPKITLRLLSRQVAGVIRADVFARELRAVPVQESQG